MLCRGHCRLPVAPRSVGSTCPFRKKVLGEARGHWLSAKLHVISSSLFILRFRKTPIEGQIDGYGSAGRAAFPVTFRVPVGRVRAGSRGACPLCSRGVRLCTAGPAFPCPDRPVHSNSVNAEN